MIGSQSYTKGNNHSKLFWVELFECGFSERPFPISLSSMIPTFKRVVKRQHHVYTHNEVDDILNYLTTSPLERGSIAKIARDIHVPEQTLRDRHHSRLVASRP
jgi:hypothetical protein